MNVETRINKDVLSELSEAMLRHPRFEEAALYYFDNVMEWRREIGFVNSMISSYARNLIIAYVCFLYFANETGVPEGGATFSRIWSIVERRKDCGSRALRTVLGVLTLVGYFRKRQGEIDKRAFAYEPTQKLLTHYGHHQVKTMHCFEIMMGPDFRSRQGANDPAKIETMMRSSGKAAIVYDIAFAEFDPLLLKIANMSGGLATLYSVARAHMNHVPLPQIADIARRYKISQSQARAVISFASENKLIGFDEAGNLLMAEPATHMIKKLLARELALYAKFTLGLEDYFMTFAES